MKLTYQRRLARMGQLQTYCGMHRSTIYRKRRLKGFPDPIEATVTSGVYDLDEVDEWLVEQRLERKGADS
jgi:predicted DNA-binding transcriptional regulator AlpA